MNVITLRDYAKQNNISYEAVRKQLVRYKDELAEHIIRDGRQQFLDEEAVAFLDAKRQKNPVALIQQSKDEAIEALRQEKEDLLQKIAEQADKIAALSEWKSDNAVAIAEANNRQLLLDKTTKQVEEQKEQINVLTAKNAVLSHDNEELGQKIAQAEKIAQNANMELETLVNGSFWERRKLRRELKQKNEE